MSKPTPHQRRLLEMLGKGEVLRTYQNEHGGMTKTLAGVTVSAATYGVFRRNRWIESDDGSNWRIGREGRRTLGVGAMMKGRCKTCRHWVDDPDDWTIHPWDQDTHAPMKFEFEVRLCKSPKLLMLERPIESDGASVTDASDYMAHLLTAEDFGCVNWESNE